MTKSSKKEVKTIELRNITLHKGPNQTFNTARDLGNLVTWQREYEDELLWYSQHVLSRGDKTRKKKRDKCGKERDKCENPDT